MSPIGRVITLLVVMMLPGIILAQSSDAVLVGIVFPAIFAAAVAVAVGALIVVLDRVLSPREQHEAPLGYWTL